MLYIILGMSFLSLLFQVVGEGLVKYISRSNFLKIRRDNDRKTQKIVFWMSDQQAQGRHSISRTSSVLSELDDAAVDALATYYVHYRYDFQALLPHEHHAAAIILDGQFSSHKEQHALTTRLDKKISKAIRHAENAAYQGDSVLSI